MLFILPLVFLIPKLSDSLRGWLQRDPNPPGVLPVWRGVFRGRGERGWQTARLMVAPFLVYIYLGTGGFVLLSGKAAVDAELNVAFALVALFSLALSLT